MSEIDKNRRLDKAAKSRTENSDGNAGIDDCAGPDLSNRADHVDRAEHVDRSHLCTEVREMEFVSGRYKIKSLLAETANSKVFEAVDSLLDRPVALKLVELGGFSGLERSRMLERMLKEAKAASLLKHPNIVEVYSVEMHEDKAVIVMELLRGQSLDHLLAAGGGVDLQAFQKNRESLSVY